jgi:hypothetical protein
MQQVGRNYGKIKVKKAKAGLAEIPADCGYEKKFRFNVDMNSNGIMGECIEWCQVNCEGKWGWWFEQKNLFTEKWHHWEEQNSYMSFEKKKDASRFWLAVGVQNMGNRDG